MRLDHSRWAAFYANPEKYRLVYEKNLVPRDVPFPLARGIHLHSLHEARNKSLTPTATNALVLLNEGISEKAKLVGTAMYAAFKRKYDGDSRIKLVFDDGKPLAELEFDVPIPGSPHSIIGKIDEIIEYKGALWLGDLKTANAKASLSRKQTEFRWSKQPNFYLNAARLLGYPVVGMLYRVVTEHTPPQFWEVEAKRTDHDLSISLWNIHQTCEHIEFYRRTFGVDKPWPHLNHSYPCNHDYNGKPSCEYADICTKSMDELTEDDLAPFRVRQDHIELMRGKEFDNA